jgi:hypothetical protein
MSFLRISMPMATMAWPAFSEAVAAAASILGYQCATDGQDAAPIPDRMACDKISISANGFLATFLRDVRGKTSLLMNGDRHSEAVLRTLAEELSRAVVQQYIYRMLLGDIRARGLDILKEERQADQTIRLKVRHWEN